MTTIAFVVGLLIGACIGVTLGANPPPPVDGGNEPPKK